MEKYIFKNKKAFLKLGYFVGSILLVLLVVELTAFLPLPGSWKAKLDGFYFEAERQLMFVPSYYMPFSAYNYHYYDSNFKKEMYIGYGYISDVKYKASVPEGVDPKTGAYDMEYKLTINIKGRWFNKNASFELKNGDFDRVVFAYFYVRPDVFLPSGMMFEKKKVLPDLGKTLAYRQPIFASFSWRVEDISQGDFVRYWTDADGKLLRLDFIDTRI